MTASSLRLVSHGFRGECLCEEGQPTAQELAAQPPTCHRACIDANTDTAVKGEPSSEMPCGLGAWGVLEALPAR